MALFNSQKDVCFFLFLKKDKHEHYIPLLKIPW